MSKITCRYTSSASSANVDLHISCGLCKSDSIQVDFRLQELLFGSDYLDIYSVLCLCGCDTELEAQAFSLKLGRLDGADCTYDSSDPGHGNINNRNSSSSSKAAAAASLKRLRNSQCQRMKRIYRSNNFVGYCDCCGKRFLISNIRRSEKEWRNVCNQITRTWNSSRPVSSPSAAAATVTSSALVRGPSPDAQSLVNARQPAGNRNVMVDWTPSSYADALTKRL